MPVVLSSLPARAFLPIGAFLIFADLKEFGKGASPFIAKISCRAKSREWSIRTTNWKDVLTQRQKGFEVLQFLSARPQLNQIPVLVFTGACHSALLARARELGARCVLDKHTDLKIAKQLVAFATNIGLCCG